MFRIPWECHAALTRALRGSVTYTINVKSDISNDVAFVAAEVTFA
jgi:hypothetical protein